MSHQFFNNFFKQAATAQAAPSKAPGPVPIATDDLRHIAGGTSAPGKNW